MSKIGSRRGELEAKVRTLKSREKTAINHYKAALRYAKENSAHGKTLEARQNQDTLLKISRRASQATQAAKTELEAHQIIEAQSKKRELDRQIPLKAKSAPSQHTEIDRSDRDGVSAKSNKISMADLKTQNTKNKDKSKTRGFKRRGIEDDFER